MANLSYMQRRSSGIYEFRRRLPTELAGRLAPLHLRETLAELINPTTGQFKRELTISLGTNDPTKAKRLDMREAVRVGDLMDLAKRLVRGEARPERDGTSTLTPEEIEADILAGLLKADEEERERGDARRYEQTMLQRLQWPDLEPPGFGTLGMAEGHLELLDEHIGELRTEYREALARRRPAIVRPELHAYLKERAVPIDPSSTFYRDAGMAVLRAHARAYDMKSQRQLGEDVPTPLPSPAKGPKLSAAFALWKAGSPARGGRTAAAKTIREADRSVRLFLQWHGDLRLGEITKDKARDFRNAIAKVPRDLDGTERKLTLKELLKRDLKDRPGAHAATVNKHLNLLSAIITHALAESETALGDNFANPFRRVGFTIDDRQARRERLFSGPELETLFGTPVFTKGDRPAGGGGEAAFWLPLMALLTGARQGELAQLRIADLREDAEAGIWFIDIGTEGGRSIKTAGSRRQVPVHPELIRLGLLDYRKRIADGALSPDASLWPGIKSADKLNPAAAWSKWFNRYMRETAGLSDADLVFHTFRATFKRLCRDADLTEEQHDALTGHTGRGGVGRSYGAGFGLKALAGMVERIEAPKAVRELVV